MVVEGFDVWEFVIVVAMNRLIEGPIIEQFVFKGGVVEKVENFVIEDIICNDVVFSYIVS